MAKDGKHITQLIEDSLRNAISKGKSGRVDGSQVHFKRVVFSAAHNLVVVEIGRAQFRKLPELSFAVNTLQESRFSTPNFSRVDIMELEENTYLYFWVTSNEQFEAENLAYAI